ncbi:hypothetical protein N7457_006769 [Penicillium paradoxum]|uniref:uncharacterized protein n=1 Tax=Penicillium paradoxum TaxID=176176 RepID=UPI00254894B5|nr:uncharacterized protein N7457_006769 [Penicillium paradoxum]KAJ5779049.1 hypothetical protein N7457_006769 [Penicillium paradoxum]
MACNEGIQGHGKKRPAQTDPDGAQPLTKKFGHLRIDNNVPISARAKLKGHIQHIQHIQHIPDIQHNQHNPPHQHDHIEHSSSSPDRGDKMWLDDTKHTTYIHDLEQELMEADSPNGLVFLPFAAKVLSVPQSVLSDSKASGKELVLYTEPTSLTVPREKDHVRKAILESRARARAESNKSINPPVGSLRTPEDYSPYDDPMDIDN